MKTINTQDLAQWLDATLQVQRFKDYCPNGLQVEGKRQISHIITGVTASEALLQEAIRRKADAVIVHHGWFWKNENPVVKGAKKRRLALALAHDLNIFGFHLPLDAHPEYGNNAQLGLQLGLEPLRDTEGAPLTCGPENLVWLGQCPKGRTLGGLADDAEKALSRKPLVIGDPNHKPNRIAWCTGGAQNFVDAAIEHGADLFITGEASEPNFHIANETGVSFMAAGHHATERYGVRALGEAIQKKWGVRVTFVDLDNPI
mgnify:FL=1